MVKRLVYLVLFLAVLTGADLVLRNVAEKQVEDQVRSQIHGSASVKASIPAFPFVPRILTNGSVPKVKVRISQLPGPPINIATIEVTAIGVVISRHDLFSHRRVDLVGIDKGEVAVELTQQALGDVLNAPVQITGGRITVTVAGQAVVATPVVTKDNRLKLELTTGATSLPAIGVGQTSLVPCVSAVTVEEGKVRLSCTFNHIPAALVRAANKS